ncbi:ARM repeat-containing protein [Mycena indigotica]|uniref:ARM repeat-containing protein n=1 Tax=Mycena indigotica TaxID=2126181 RepID=A0A8H6S289_9AGAR|nr:ARM repeat-containing protein [Mycena indigotica]KAF7290517.1 ARM repeat-containing protein [Mycena indigotica]
MGKSQKKRTMRRHNPVRVPDSHLPKGLASAEETSSKKNAILPIMQKMEGTDPVERKWACVAVSNLIQNDPSTRRLLQGKNIVSALITRLTDSEEEVVVEAMGALRNLCIDGGYEICAEMYNKNILTPLKAFVPKLATTLSEYLAKTKTAPETQKKLVYEFSDNVITVLWCLSETSNKALAAINELNLIPFLVSFLAAHDKIPLAPVTAAAHCLYVLTDDNPPAIDQIRVDATYIACLMSFLAPDNDQNDPKEKDPRTTTLRVLASGIIRNVSPIPPPSIVSNLDIDKDVVLPQLQRIISGFSIAAASSSVLEILARQDSTPSIQNLSLHHTPKSDHRSPAEIELEQIEGRLRTIQLSLEILTGVCATLPDPDPPSTSDEPEGEDDDLLVMDEEHADDSDMAVDEKVAQSLPSLVQPLLELITPTTLSFPPFASPSPHPPTTSALSALHVAALECLNNIFIALARGGRIDDIAGGQAVWNSIWATVEAVGTQSGPGQEHRREMWEIGVGVLWGVASVCRPHIEPQTEQVRILMGLCNDPSAEAVLQVKCIGTLECLAQNPCNLDANKSIAEFLLSILPSSGSPSPTGTEPMLQAVSSLIDIYSDELSPYDVNFRQGNFLRRLTDSLDGVKKAVRAIDRRREYNLRRHGEEVRDNLIGFIEYRRGLSL